MLANREIQTITKNKVYPSETIEDLNDIKEKHRISNLFEYFKIRKQENNFSNVELVLLKYLSEDLSLKIIKK